MNAQEFEELVIEQQRVTKRNKAEQSKTKPSFVTPLLPLCYPFAIRKLD